MALTWEHACLSKGRVSFINQTKLAKIFSSNYHQYLVLLHSDSNNSPLLPPFADMLHTYRIHNEKYQKQRKKSIDLVLILVCIILFHSVTTPYNRIELSTRIRHTRDGQREGLLRILFVIYIQTKVKQHHKYSETLFWKLQNGICR